MHWRIPPPWLRLTTLQKRSGNSRNVAAVFWLQMIGKTRKISGGFLPELVRIVRPEIIPFFVKHDLKESVEVLRGKKLDPSPPQTWQTCAKRLDHRRHRHLGNAYPPPAIKDSSLLLYSSVKTFQGIFYYVPLLFHNFSQKQFLENVFGFEVFRTDLGIFKSSEIMYTSASWGCGWVWVWVWVGG